MLLLAASQTQQPVRCLEPPSLGQQPSQALATQHLLLRLSELLLPCIAPFPSRSFPLFFKPAPAGPRPRRSPATAPNRLPPLRRGDPPRGRLPPSGRRPTGRAQERERAATEIKQPASRPLLPCPYRACAPPPAPTAQPPFAPSGWLAPWRILGIVVRRRAGCGLRAGGGAACGCRVRAPLPGPRVLMKNRGGLGLSFRKGTAAGVPLGLLGGYDSSWG